MSFSSVSRKSATYLAGQVASKSIITPLLTVSRNTSFSLDKTTALSPFKHEK
ncbi:hypothetical protein JCM19237_5474 [Photobacterium aphoticum]|uniref:Uncharacterized protein n=1 Tax=Photobacterium aphoticum TaxID=754436 RepID=A0A090QI43_9GAMM|nr:hypothetical protein JCM19237_5474 [Photobacterium aphoticum]